MRQLVLLQAVVLAGTSSLLLSQRHTGILTLDRYDDLADSYNEACGAAFTASGFVNIIMQPMPVKATDPVNYAEWNRLAKLFTALFGVAPLTNGNVRPALTMAKSREHPMAKAVCVITACV